MAYANVKDVEILVQQRNYNSSSNPTESQVKIILEWIEAEMNGALCNVGYIVPITGPFSLEILRQINALGAASMSEGAAFMSSEKNESRHASWLNARFKEKFEKVLSGKVKLADANFDMDRAPRTYMKSSLEGQAHIFSMEGLRDFVDLHKRLSLGELHKWLVQSPERYHAIQYFENCATFPAGILN